MKQKDEALRMAIANLEVLKESALRGNHVFTETADWTIEKCKAALSEPEIATLPDGWVAVPVEPTADMLKSTLEVHCRSIDNFSWTAMYKAMLHAAPTLNEKG